MTHRQMKQLAEKKVQKKTRDIFKKETGAQVERSLGKEAQKEPQEISKLKKKN